MTTKSSGSAERGAKTVVTDNSSDVANHKLEEGCAREAMYSHRSCYDGVRQSYLSDDPMGNEMRKWK